MTISFYLSSFYFVYFGLLGALLPYLGLYLADKGFSLTQIASLSSLLMATKIFAPVVWGWCADHFGNRIFLIRFGAIGSVFSFTCFYWADAFWTMFWVIGLFSFFWNAILAQFEVVTMNCLGSKQARYSEVRLWGSIGFIVIALASGWLIDQYGIQWFPWILLVLLSSIVLASFGPFERETDNTQSEQGVSISGYHIDWPTVLAFYSVCLLLQVSHGAYYTYFSLYMTELGYSETLVGILWALGVTAEIIVFKLMPRWLSRVSLTVVMTLSLLLTALRWLCLALFPENWMMLCFVQILHAFSFGAMHAAAIQLVHQSFSPHQQGRAQAVYSAIGFGLGGAIGAFVSGFIVDYWTYSHAFLFASLVALCAAFLSQRFLNRGKASLN